MICIGGKGMAQHTRRAIQRAFINLLQEVSFNKISIVAIARKSEVTRNTVYYYYQDVFALLEELLDHEKRRLIAEVGKEDSWDEVLTAVISFSSKNRVIVRNLCSCNNVQAHDMIYGFYHDLFRYGIESYLNREAKGLTVNSADRQTLIEFNTTAIHGIFNEWLMSDMNNDIESYITSLNRVLKGNIRRSLEQVSYFRPVSVSAG